MNARIEGEIGAAAAGLNELRETGLVTDNLTPVSASRCAELCVCSVLCSSFCCRYTDPAAFLIRFIHISAP